MKNSNISIILAIALISQGFMTIANATTTTENTTLSVSTNLPQSTKTKIDTWIATKIVSRQGTMNTNDYTKFINALITKITIMRGGITNQNNLAVINYLLSKLSDSTIADNIVPRVSTPQAPTLSVNKPKFTMEEAEHGDIVFTWAANGWTDCIIGRWAMPDYVSIPSTPKVDSRAIFSFPTINTFTPKAESSAGIWTYRVICTQADGSKKSSEKVSVKVTGLVGTEFTKVETPGYVCSPNGLINSAFTGPTCTDEGAYTYTKKNIYYDGN